MPIGFSFPFQVSTGSLGYFECTNDELSAIAQNLRSLMVTNWGERVMNSNFGFNMIEFIFEQARDDELKSRIADRAIDQVKTWMPYLELETLNVLFQSDDPSLDPNEMRLSIGFKLVDRPDVGGTVTEII